MGNVVDVRREMTKTKEQLEEEKKISLSIRIRPLELDGNLLSYLLFFLQIPITIRTRLLETHVN